MEITVLLLEDSRVSRSAIEHILEAERNIRPVGEAQNFLQMLEMCADLRPTVVLLDLHIPGQQFRPGDITSSLPSAKYILAISLRDDVESQSLASGSGASALLDNAQL